MSISRSEEVNIGIPPNQPTKAYRGQTPSGAASSSQHGDAQPRALCARPERGSLGSPTGRSFDDAFQGCPHAWDANPDQLGRHYCADCPSWRRWIKWMLVGNADLGFIDKHYKL